MLNAQLSSAFLTSRLEIVADTASESRTLPSYVLPVASLQWGPTAPSNGAVQFEGGVTPPSNGEGDITLPFVVRATSFASMLSSEDPNGTFRSGTRSAGGRTRFSLQGELMHAFICYRVASEGDAGNGLSARIYERIRELSLDTEQNKLQIPRPPPPINPKP